LKISREFKVGFVFVAAAAIFIWGFNLLKGTDILSNKRFLYAVYDRVDGLEKDNKVLINGLNIGKVNRLDFIQGTSSILVELYIQNDVEIPKNSIALIKGTDLLGTKAIEIIFGDSPENAKNYDTIPAQLEQSLMSQVNEQVEPLKRKALALISSIDSTMTDIQSVFDENTRNNLESMIEKIKNTLSNAEDATSKIDNILTEGQPRIKTVMSNLESISSNLKENNENITTILTNFAALSDSLGSAEIPETMRKANAAMKNLKSITDKINNGEGSLGQLMTNDSLYIELENSTEALRKLLEDIQANPKKYVKFSLF
jgi:phospholipid/cholesterol/gamma-HCH transport system substrate-binding protein